MTRCTRIVTVSAILLVAGGVALLWGSSHIASTPEDAGSGTTTFVPIFASLIPVYIAAFSRRRRKGCKKNG